ncbi:hypothetical protein [Bradyrhizobium sp. USDA 4504]
MKTPPSPHFAPVDLKRYYNARRREIDAEFGQKRGGNDWSTNLKGLQTFRGIPFLLGNDTGPDLLVLRPQDNPIIIELPPAPATYVLFVQAASDRSPTTPHGFGRIGPIRHSSLPSESTELGDLVSTYALRYADGSESDVPVLRRFAIQQRHISWGALPFGAVPARGPSVYATHGEDLALERAPSLSFGYAEMRTLSGRISGTEGENLWLYALPNPCPHKVITDLLLRAENEISLIYAVSTTNLAEHPLRLQGRRKLRMRLPSGVDLNALGELDTDDRGDQIGIDLGTVISARAVLEYSRSDWLSDLHDAQPVPSDTEVIVEYSAHPDARLYLRSQDRSLLMWELRSLESARVPAASALEAIAIEPATRPVKFRIVEKGTDRLVAARLHIHGSHGEYLPPKGHHRKVNTGWFEDYSAELANGLNHYAYVDGDCIVDLPFGPVFVEITRGFEMRPMRRIVDIDAHTETLNFELEKVLRWP